MTPRFILSIKKFFSTSRLFRYYPKISPKVFVSFLDLDAYCMKILCMYRMQGWVSVSLSSKLVTNCANFIHYIVPQPSGTESLPCHTDSQAWWLAPLVRFYGPSGFL